MRLLLTFVFLLSVPVFAQEQKSLTFDQVKEIQMEVMRQKWIRIAEPAIHPLQVFGMKSYVGIEDEVFQNCGRRVLTELGQAWVSCDAKPESIIWYHGGPIEDMWGDRVIDVTVEGYDTHKSLCYLDYNNPNLGLGLCTEGTLRTKIEPVVLARLSIITKVNRYTKKDVDDWDDYIRKDKEQGVVWLIDGVVAEPKSLVLGNVISWEVAASKVSYEFPKLGK